MRRVWRATINSRNGLTFAFRSEQAFREEVVALALAVPLAFAIGATAMRSIELIGVVLLVMVVELLNTGIEAAIDRIGPEWHALSKRAKDMGSAAVLLALLLAGGIWSAALWHRFFP